MAAANRVQDVLTRNFRTASPAINCSPWRARRDRRRVAAGDLHASNRHARPWRGGLDRGVGEPVGRAGRGDYPVNANTAWSIELMAVRKVPEWNNQEVRFPLEVDGFFDGKSFRWIDGRQTELHLIPRNAQNRSRRAAMHERPWELSEPNGGR
jgi:hypothetical protein